MIRYNSEDGIQTVKSSEGILESFKIMDGRVGEYILDQNNKKIPLTGLIYGRHHLLFGQCRSLQISQDIPGKAKIYYCVLPNSELSDSASHLFDSSGVEIEFSFEQCADPIRTKAGKIGLLVGSELKKNEPNQPRSGWRQLLPSRVVRMPKSLQVGLWAPTTGILGPIAACPMFSIMVSQEF